MVLSILFVLFILVLFGFTLSRGFWILPGLPPGVYPFESVFFFHCVSFFLALIWEKVSARARPFGPIMLKCDPLIPLDWVLQLVANLRVQLQFGSVLVKLLGYLHECPWKLTVLIWC